MDLHERQLRWFDYWLRDIETGIMEEPPVTLFVMGENRWRSLEEWPPPSAHYVPYYLHSRGSANTLHGDGSLFTVPPDDEPPDTYTYDPEDPVLSLGGNDLTIPLGIQDQRPVEERRDVLVFTSDPIQRRLEVPSLQLCRGFWT